jgi:hypothetical protein
VLRRSAHPLAEFEFGGFDKAGVKVRAIVSPLRLLKRREEFVPVARVNDLPRGMRGIYVLYVHRPRIKRFDVVYVGMAATGGIRPRLRSHTAKKKDLWTHCSVFEVWENITPDEVKELEGILRHIYRKDSRAARLAVQRSFARMKKLPPILPPVRKKKAK